MVIFDKFTSHPEHLKLVELGNIVADFVTLLEAISLLVVLDKFLIFA